MNNASFEWVVTLGQRAWQKWKSQVLAATQKHFVAKSSASSSSSSSSSASATASAKPSLRGLCADGKSRKRLQWTREEVDELLHWCDTLSIDPTRKQLKRKSFVATSVLQPVLDASSFLQQRQRTVNDMWMKIHSLMVKNKTRNWQELLGRYKADANIKINNSNKQVKGRLII